MNQVNQTRLSQAARNTFRAAYPQEPTVGSTSFESWMLTRSLTPRDVAGDLGCTSASVTAWASGRRVPTIELARRIEGLAGIPIAAWVTMLPEVSNG